MPQRQPTETELKLVLTEAGARAVLARPDFATAQSRHETTTYFDTPGHALATMGVALRIRQRDAGKRIQTLKTQGAPGVAAARGEWEWEVAGDRPDLTRLNETPLASRLPPRLADHLHPAFVTDIERTTVRLHLDGAVAEAALDRGAIRAGTAREAVLELELELLEGTMAPLYRLALSLHAAEALRIGTESKAARGLRLAGFSLPPQAASPPALQPQDSGGAAFRALVLNQLGQLLAQGAAARAGEVEGVHQMRILLRRLRSTLVLFAPLLQRDTAAHFNQGLRQLGRALGEARDWDVFCTHTLPATLQAAPDQGWAAKGQARRQAAHEALARELDGPGFTRLVLEMAAWAEESAARPAALGEAALDQSLATLAPGLLDRMARKVSKRGRRLARRSDAERHAFRKALKKLRYAIEALSPILPQDQAAQYLHRCVRLLKLLGRANDSIAGSSLAEEVVADHTALAPFERQLQARHDKAVHKMRHAWHALRREKPFWRHAA